MDRYFLLDPMPEKLVWKAGLYSFPLMRGGGGGGVTHTDVSCAD